MPWLQKDARGGTQDVREVRSTGSLLCVTEQSCPSVLVWNNGIRIVLTAQGHGENQRAECMAAHGWVHGPLVTLRVFTSVCYSLSEQKNQGDPVKPPNITLLPLWHLTDTCKLHQVPTVPVPSQRGQPTGPHRATHHPARSANLRLSDHVSQGKYTYNLLGFLISPKTK